MPDATDLQNHEAKALLAEIVDRYLNSDFNGLFISAGDERGEAARDLIRDGSVEVIGEKDFPNPHIRPWASRRSRDEQLASLSAALAGESYGVCLYPLGAVLQGREELSRLANRPYTQRLAAGAGQLDIAYFRMDVLESYRN